MPYLNLGGRSINYIKPTNDKLIVSSIVNSSSSYQYPTLVRSSSELEIYFGKSFEEKSYFDELIDKGATLYLYRPISTKKRKIDDDIDEDVETPDDESLLPENLPIPENYVSWDNRDTLRLINTKGTQGNGFTFDHCYPEYNSTYNYRMDDHIMESINTDNLENDYDTFSFDLDFSGVESFAPSRVGEDPFYITLPVFRRNVLLWFRYDESIYIPPIGGDFIGPSTIEVVTYDEHGAQLPRETILEKVIEALRTPYVDGAENQGFGYEINVGSDKNKIEIWRYYQEPNTYFFNLPGLSITSNFRKNQDILSMVSEKAKRLEFYSKTIGQNDEDICIKIEKINYHDDKYRVYISRFDYEEIYEVNLYENPNDPDVNIIDYTINKNSKLVSCKLIRTIDNILVKDDLPTGTWYMRGSSKESYSYENRLKSLDILQYSEAIDDLLVINNINDWTDDITSQDFNLYERLLDYCKEKDNQALISNRDEEYKYNLTDDLDNRLVYFYGDMKYMYQLRPPYYVFLNGLLTDVYSVEARYVRYDVPNLSLGDELDKYKSNYLVDSNLFLYYENYKNHVEDGKVNTNIITRFIISKVGREIRRNKWNIIDKQSTTEKERVVDSILESLSKTYSMILSLSVISIDENIAEHKLNINLKLKVAELVDKDITLGVTLNYIE